MGQKGHIIDQKGLKLHEKRQKIEFSNLKYLLFSGIFLSEIGVLPSPLNQKSFSPKSLAELGDTPPPLIGKIPLSSILRPS